MTINTDIITLIFLLMLLLSVILVVLTSKLINAVVYMGVFSFLAAVVFLLLGAPDVALAEAIIGSTLSTIIYLIAIKKFKIFTVYHINNKDYDTKRETYINQVIKDLFSYLKSKEMQQNIIHTNLSLETLIKHEEQCFIIENTDDAIVIHSNNITLHNQNIKELIRKYNFPVEVKLSQDIIYENLPYKRGEDNEKV